MSSHLDERQSLQISGWPAFKNAAVNPFQKLLYESVGGCEAVVVREFDIRSLLSLKAPDILHLHWPDVFVASGRGWRFWLKLLALRGALFVACMRGIKIVWTAHNMRRKGQQNEAQMERWFWPWFLRQVDGIIFMTQASAAQARQENPEIDKTAYAVISHGSYLPVIGDAPPVPVDATTRPQALFFGAISRYKNAWKLLDAFLGLEPGKARLRISGKVSHSIPDNKLVETLSELSKEHAEDILFEDRFVPDEELVSIIRGSDLVVFPYADVLNSGAAIYALSAGRPLLASDNALFRELQSQVGPQWVTLIEGELDPEQLSRALEAARALRQTGASPDLAAFDWNEIARQTVAFYRELIAGHGAK